MQLDLELYREEIEVEPGVTISFIDVAPERPSHIMVLVHGFGGNATQWQYQFEDFTDRNRVIALDLRGHGRSSRPSDGYDMPRMVADIKALLDRLNISQKVVLVGHSYGVALATEFAWRFPERVSHLVLVAGAGEYKIPDYYRFLFRMPQGLMRLLQPLVGNWVQASLQALKQMYLHNVRTWQGWDKFPELQPPTMVILGERDRVLDQRAYERVAELVPRQTSEVVNVDVSAHMVMLERRGAVNRAIERFIAPVTAARQQAGWRSRFDYGSRGSLLRERPWLAHYETGVPATIHVPRLPLTRLLQRAARRFPNRPATRFFGATLTYRQLYEQAARLAQGLHALGLAPGDRVLLMLPNVPQFAIAYYGALLAGGVVVMANPLAPPAEVVQLARQAEARVLIALTRYQNTAAEVHAQTTVAHVILTPFKTYMPFFKRLWFGLRHEAREGGRLSAVAAGAFQEWQSLLRGAAKTPPDVSLQAQDTALLQFSTAADQQPHPAQLSHYNLLANTLQLRAWFSQAQAGSESVLSVVPLSHHYGMTAAMNVPISQGACMLLLPRFDVAEVLETIRRERPAYFPGVPAMYTAINAFPNVRRYELQSVEICLSSAAPLPVEVEEAFEKLTKGRLIEGYGLREATAITHASPIYGTDKVGFIGLPLPNTEARIVDLQSGRPLPPGQVGELVVRGPQVMTGYWQAPDATAAALDRHGWLHTGDVARMDHDGYFQIISRSADVWTVGEAAPLYPRDVEEVLYELPEVEEVIVVPVAGQLVAFIRRREDGGAFTAQTVIAYSQRRLPPEQVPRLVVFVRDFPRNLIGKVLRRELAERYEKQIIAEAGSVGLYLDGLPTAAPVRAPSAAAPETSLD